MSECTEVERPFMEQLAELGWTVIDHGAGIPQEAAPGLRDNFRQWLLPDVFDAAVHAINRDDEGRAWLTDRQLEDLRGQLLRQPNRTLLEAAGATAYQKTGRILRCQGRCGNEFGAAKGTGISVGGVSEKW